MARHGGKPASSRHLMTPRPGSCEGLGAARLHLPARQAILMHDWVCAGAVCRILRPACGMCWPYRPGSMRGPGQAPPFPRPGRHLPALLEPLSCAHHTSTAACQAHAQRYDPRHQNLNFLLSLAAFSAALRFCAAALAATMSDRSSRPLAALASATLASYSSRSASSDRFSKSCQSVRKHVWVRGLG